MFHLGTTELIIILIIILFLFGVGRISKITSELGKGVTAFRSALNKKEEDNKIETSKSKG